MSLDTQLTVNNFGCDWKISVTDKTIIISTDPMNDFSLRDSKYGYMVSITLWRSGKDYIFNGADVGREPPPSRIANGSRNYRTGRRITVKPNPKREQAILARVKPWALRWANSEEAKIIVSLMRKDKDENNLIRISDGLTFWEEALRTTQANVNILRDVLAKTLAGEILQDDVCSALTSGYNSPTRKLKLPT